MDETFVTCSLIGGLNYDKLIMLTQKQFLHVEMTLAWTSLFRRVSKKYETKWWRFGPQTVEMINANKAGNDVAISRLHRAREHHMFWATNRREGKVVQVYCQLPNFNEGCAYLEYYDPDYVNYSS